MWRRERHTPALCNCSASLPSYSSMRPSHTSPRPPQAGELGESACERPGDAPGQPGGSARFLVCVVEAEGAQGRSGGLEVGMVAVETATGAVLFSQFRCGEEGERMVPRGAPLF